MTTPDIMPLATLTVEFSTSPAPFLRKSMTLPKRESQLISSRSSLSICRISSGLFFASLSSSSATLSMKTGTFLPISDAVEAT